MGAGSSGAGILARIAERFVSVQGEGSEAGVPMFFVRLAGCSVSQCPLHPARSGLCDTDWKYTETLSCESLVSEIPRGIHWLCITGGEPTDQIVAVNELSRLAHQRDMRVMLQTSGAREVSGVFDWLVVSPKMPPLDIRQASGHELKLVYSGQDREILRMYIDSTKFHRYYLMPLWKDGTSNAEEVAKLVIELTKDGLPWRATLQSHKYMNVH